MGPRESKYGRGGTPLPDDKEPNRLTRGEMAPGSVSVFVAQFFRHYTAAKIHDAAEAFKTHLDKGGQAAIALAGAFSTGELGRILAPMIRAGKIHAISCTSANLDESVMNLVGHDDYESFPDYEELTPKDDEALADRGVNRVTDTGVPTKVMTPVEQAFFDQLDRAKATGERPFAHELFYRLLLDGTLEPHYQDDPANCWLLAAAEKNLPVFVAGFEDGTVANVFEAQCYKGKYDWTDVKHGTEYMGLAIEWYKEASAEHDLAFLQCGGGIPGDMLICVAPLLILDADEPKTPMWKYFVQFSSGSPDAYGGYSEAKPGEKRSWRKLPANAPSFDIQGDYSVNFALFAAYVMGW